jgi:transcriptional regulator with XRE-family HTH domain
MAGNKVTPKARALGLALVEARQARGLDQRALAELVDIHHSTLSRYETGQRNPTTETVAQILATLGVNGERLQEIVALARGTDEPWLALTLPEQQRQLGTLLDLECKATTITDVSPLLVPGLLQTIDYARAIMIESEVPADQIETRVRVRIGRREVLTRRNPVHLTALIGESALRQMIGGPQVMADQLRYLLDVAKLPTVDLRAIPGDRGWHPGLEGPFVVVELAEGGPVVHFELRESGLFLHEDPDVAAYQEAARKVFRAAMSPTETVGLIASEAKRIERIA